MVKKTPSVKKEQKNKDCKRTKTDDYQFSENTFVQDMEGNVR